MYHPLYTICKPTWKTQNTAKIEVKHMKLDNKCRPAEQVLQWRMNKVKN